MDLKNLTPTEKKKLKQIAQDPVLWAKAFIRTFDPEKKKYVPWEARWYQAEMLRDKSLKKVARCGRRTGKCLPGWVKVFDPVSGDRVSIEELYRRGQANIVTMTEDYKLASASTDIVLDNGVKDVFRVTLSSGKEIDATGNHPLYTINGWKMIDELKPGDYVATPKILDFFGDLEVSDEEVILAVNMLSREADEKAIPDFVFQLNRRQMALFLSRLFTTGGRVSDREIGYCMTSKELALGIQHLLLRFGIASYFRSENSKCYQLGIGGYENIKKFAEEINMPEKEDSVQRLVEQLAKRESAKKEVALKANSEIVWEEIKSIEYLGRYQTYDLTVPVTHNFVANDIIVHNTETMVVDALHKIYTTPHYRVLFVTPYENQVRMIFTRIKELIEASPLLKPEVVRSTQNPFQLVLKNGSAVLGFTTGASSGSGAPSIRGQRADYIFMDEVDYMHDADFDTIMTIAAERPDIGIFMSSTPTGRRGKFYQACTNKKLGFTEHYHPSTHNPNWNEQMEAEFRAQLSEQGYIHEILAEFGTEETGVFNKEKVDRASSYEYYAYQELTYTQKLKMQELGIEPVYYLHDINHRAPMNAFRTMGVDRLVPVHYKPGELPETPSWQPAA